MEKFDFKALDKEKSSLAESGDFRSGFFSVFNPVKETEAEENPAPVDIVPQPDPEVIKLQMEKEITQSRAKGFEEGYAKGYSDARLEADEVNKQVELGVRLLVDGLNQLIEQKKLQCKREVSDVADIILRVTKKITQAELSANAAEMVEKVVRKSFELLFDEPLIVISVNPMIYEGLQERFANLAKNEGFKGKVEVVPDDKLSVASSQIEWKGGGLCSDKENAWLEVEKLAKDCLNKKRGKKTA
ncbi:MAG: hypothetical protein K0R98_1813 [Rickettsiaceae bacterium]|jgi:flagellar assembly protein FliH|nr:hypothetical protein [Rickettsiaceae bacterium]